MGPDRRRQPSDESDLQLETFGWRRVWGASLRPAKTGTLKRGLYVLSLADTEREQEFCATDIHAHVWRRRRDSFHPFLSDLEGRSVSLDHENMSSVPLGQIAPEHGNLIFAVLVLSPKKQSQPRSLFQLKHLG